MKYTGGGIGTLPQIERVNMEVADNELKSDVRSDWDQYLQPDNLHGIKLYREPYDRDIYDLLSMLSGATPWVSIVKILFS